MQATVRDLLMRKKSGVTTVRAEDSVFDAVQCLIKHNIGAVLVMQEDKILGILSERDVARKVVLAGKVAADTRVGEIMTREVVCVHPDETVEACMELMTDRRIRHLPVVEAEQMTGIVSIGDLVNSLISQKQFVIEQLENYITGRI
jgi:CBS domain-containing protein